MSNFSKLVHGRGRSRKDESVEYGVSGLGGLWGRESLRGVYFMHTCLFTGRKMHVILAQEKKKR